MSNAPRLAAARRSWGDDDSGTPILHVDMDAFFAAVEILDHPHLRGLPVAVGGPDRGVISAASYEARAFGVRAAQSVAHAKQLCPQLVLQPARMRRYQEVSRSVMAILQRVTPHVQQVSVDEAYLDVAGARRLWGSALPIATQLRQTIHREIGVVASIGIGDTKLLAKLASAHAKPDGLLLVPADRSLDFLHLLPIGALPGVGRVTAQSLHLRGVETVGDLARLDTSQLSKWVGRAAGVRLAALARNDDRRQVRPGRVEKSYGTETTFFTADVTAAQLRRTVLRQAHTCGRQLRQRHRLAATVVVKVKTPDFRLHTRSRTLAQPTDLDAELAAIALRLLAEMSLAGPVRLVGVRVEGVVERAAGVQFALDSDGRQQATQRSIDEVLDRFGPRAVQPASLLAGQKGDGPGSKTAIRGRRAGYPVGSEQNGAEDGPVRTRT